jgi:hypothetical protein
MITLSEITEHPVYRIRVGVWADFQDFVMVGERRGVHKITLPRINDGSIVSASDYVETLFGKRGHGRNGFHQPEDPRSHSFARADACPQPFILVPREQTCRTHPKMSPTGGTMKEETNTAGRENNCPTRSTTKEIQNASIKIATEL